MDKRKIIVLLLVLASMLMIGALSMMFLQSYPPLIAFLDPFPPSTPCPTAICAPDLSYRRIAFSSDRFYLGREVYVMNADGTCAIRLTDFSDRHAAMGPHWSPDGMLILFELHRHYGSGPPWSDTDLYTVAADGSQVMRLTNRGKNIGGQWSPDGSKIAFLSDRDGYWMLYVMNADGSQETRLTDVELADKYDEIAWSPDGARIAFTGLHSEEGQSEVYVASVHEGWAANLSNHPAADKVVTWLPEENRILFTSDRSLDGEASQQWRLYLMDIDGTNVQRIAALGSNPYHRVRGWAPTSTLQLILSEWRQVYILDVECVLENPSESDTLPEGCYYRIPEPHSQSPSVGLQWCPGDSQLTFDVVRISGGREDGSDIVVMNFDGTGVTNLTNCSAYNSDPDWSP